MEEPSIYESVRVHTAMQTGRTENDLVPTAPSVSGHQSDIALSLSSRKNSAIRMIYFLKYVYSHKNSTRDIKLVKELKV